MLSNKSHVYYMSHVTLRENRVANSQFRHIQCSGFHHIRPVSFKLLSLLLCYIQTGVFSTCHDEGGYNVIAALHSSFDEGCEPSTVLDLCVCSRVVVQEIVDCADVTWPTTKYEKCRQVVRNKSTDKTGINLTHCTTIHIEG